MIYNALGLADDCETGGAQLLDAEEEPLGVAVRTGLGDGLYNVYATLVYSGAPQGWVVSKIEIEFVSPAEIAEQDDSVVSE